MNTQIIKLSEFSTKPFGRFKSDGPKSGELFREQLLVEALQSGAEVTVDLDGLVNEVGSSFWEEAFGGLLRTAGVEYEYLRERLKIVGSRSDYINECWQHIENQHEYRGIK